MKFWLIAIVLATRLLAADAVTFVNEGVIDAPIEEVWKVVSTSEGYRVLGPAQAEVDLRIGGTIRARYGNDGPLGDDQTIENRILAYEPPIMMATQIQKPPKTFPFKEAWRKPWTVLTLKPLDGGRTLVRAASLGYGTDSESRAMQKFFESGNQQVIQNIQKHFANR
jgi:uncharacterized protein YndB with AHSA1/START domain